MHDHLAATTRATTRRPVTSARRRPQLHGPTWRLRRTARRGARGRRPTHGEMCRVQPLVVPARFNGPPASGNGGWVSGRLAALLDPAPADAVQVVLRSPPPLDVPLQLQLGADGGLSVWSGDAPVASANRVPSPFRGPAPAEVSFEAAQAAAATYAGARDHPFPTCFVCGPDRAPGDGLRFAPGRLDDRPAETAAAWVPDASLADDGTGAVDLASCWAALDCPGGWALDLIGRPMVLGTMTAQVRTLPHVGGRYVVVGRALDRVGSAAGTGSRKARTETALYDVDAPGAPLARATAIWLRVDPAAVRPV